MKKGKIVTHKDYGKARIDSVWLCDRRIKVVGVTLNLLTENGKSLFYMDRNGFLPRCYENNLSLITQ